MPRSNWKGFISFGLVNIPIILYNSENTAEKVSFHQIDKKTFARIKYKRVNAETGKEVPWENIIKGYEYDKNTILPVEEGELERVAGENARSIAIENFVSENSINLIDVYKTYYLAPDKNGEKGYVILREALKKTKSIGIAKVIISTKEYIAAIACYENAIVLYLLHYHKEIRPLAELKLPEENLKKYKVTPKEVEIAQQLIKSMSTKWKPEKYKDEFQEVVHKWAENRIKHKPIIQMQPRAHMEKTGKAVDFVDLLKKSLGKTKKSKKASAVIAHSKKKSHGGKRATMH